jgi:tripartite-type tricarboxylate transporter receptor subunit TctC
MTSSSIILVVFASTFFIAMSSTASRAADFYKGKTIRFIVGYAPGGGYDTYTRAIARHIGRFLPVKPASVVEKRGRRRQFTGRQLHVQQS